MPLIFFDAESGKRYRVMSIYLKLIDKMVSENKQFLRYIDNPYKLHMVPNFSDALRDNFDGWHLHHIAGEYVDYQTLIKKHMYYHQPYWALEFLTERDHRRRHAKPEYDVV